MQYRYLTLALVALVACGRAETPSVEQSPTGGSAAAPSRPIAEAPAQLPIVATPSTSVEAPPVGETGAGVQPASPGEAQAPSGGQSPAQPPTTPTAQQPAPSGSEVNDILARAESALSRVQTLEADFSSVTTNFLTGDTIRGRGRFFSRMPDRFLMRFTDPAGDYVLSDGNSIYTYYPTNDPRTVTRGRLGQGGPLAEAGQSFNFYREFVSDAAERYNATLDGTESVGGRPAQVVTLVPRSQSPYRQIRIWVDTQDSLVRRFETTERNDLLRRIEMSNLRLNPTLSNDLFTFQQPPGTQIFEP